MNPGDLVLGSCSRVGCDRHDGLSQVINVKKTAYGWSRLVLLCSCGYNYEGSTLQNRRMHEDNEEMLGVDE
jgi:hypothetical protein